MPIASSLLGFSASFLCFSQVEAAPSTSTALLLFSPFKLFCLVVWVYLCLYCVQCVQTSPLVPEQFKTAAYISSLFVGPLLFLVLLTIDARRSSPDKNVFLAFKQRLEKAIADMRSSRSERQEDDSQIRLLDSGGTALEDMWGHDGAGRQDRHVLDLTEEIIGSAIERRGTDILIDPKDETTYTVRLRVDGILRTVRELDAETCKALINSVKVVSSMDISERRRPQDGAFMARKGAMSISFRVASAGALYGEKLAIRILNQGASTFALTNVGLSKKQYAIIEGAIKKPSGMVLVCGPTGSGKTSTLYAMLNQMDPFTRNIITVEDPIESFLPETSQIEINPKAGITFAKTLRSILRQDPDVICVGEIRDEETAEIGLRASQTGHLVLATIHCESNAAALVRLMDLGVSPMMLSSGLSLLVSQRLLRLLCTHCKKPAQLSQQQIDSFRKSKLDYANVFEPGNCERCEGTGYSGRTAICDILTVTEQLKGDIAKKGFVAELESKGSVKGRASLKKEGLRKVLAGLTSLDELKRVVG